VPWHEDYVTKDYRSHADAESTAERTQAEISHLAQTLAEHAPGSRVLGLGCAVGRHAIGLARPGSEVTGVDVSKYALDRADLPHGLRREVTSSSGNRWLTACRMPACTSGMEPDPATTVKPANSGSWW
jgi:2-polyprenyl-3-methyl-5-hydroxy-6-metoxy-1,4-benzoquinol methylase